MTSNDVNNEDEKISTTDYLEDLGIKFNDIYISDQIGKNSQRLADLVLSGINLSNPDILVTGASVSRYDFFNNPYFLQLINQLNCPVLIAKDFAIPVVTKAHAWLKKIFGRG